MEVEFVFKRMYRVTLHHGPLSHDVIAVKRNLVQSRCNCLHLTFALLLLVHDESSIKNSLLASTFVYPLSILKHSMSFPQRRRFSRENKLSRASLSSYDSLRKEGIIFVALRWTASNFVISFARWGDQNYTAYSKCGLTKLLYRSRIISLFLKEKFLFMKPSILLALPAASLHCWENLRFDAIVTPRTLTQCTLSSFSPLISY